MKITQQEREALAELIAGLDTEATRQRYRDGRFPRAESVRDLDTRYRWDLFYAVRGYTVLPGNLLSSHIDTALRRIVAPLEV